MSVLIRQSVRVGRSPMRALKPVRGVNAPLTSSGGPPEEKMTVPFIPREFAKDTIEFFRQSSPHVKSLLDLVFTPPVSETASEEDLEEYERMVKEYETELAKQRYRYQRHEEKAARCMHDAIRNLPEDMYDEAVRKGEMLPPESLQFHTMYRDQLMADSLSDWEQVKLQTFSNLMHIRYSHSEAKKKHRERFFISESAALNLRKERAKKEKNIL
jgi:hypothetical protein